MEAEPSNPPEVYKNAAGFAAPLFADLQSHTMMEERKVNRGGGRKSASLKDEELCPEEEERRIMPRGRNKLAAARCRKRRVDQTETLQIE